MAKQGTAARVSVEGVTPFLWFNDQAEPAARFYTSLIANSRVLDVSRAGPKGPVMTVTFELGGQRFVALNGGPVYEPTPAFSIFVACRSQVEVDRLWGSLTRGGEESRCGWLVDRYGLSWQIIPNRLPELLSDPDPGRASRALAAMMTMQKIDVAALERAADGDASAPPRGRAVRRTRGSPRAR